MNQLEQEMALVRQKSEEQLASLQAQLDKLQDQANDIVDKTHAALKQLVAKHGFIWCEKCDGTGAIERLDSGYMKRFGLREWDGCEDCGGEKEHRGRGYK